MRVVLGIGLVNIRLIFRPQQRKKAVKVWRFNPDETENMTLEDMEGEITALISWHTSSWTRVAVQISRLLCWYNACNALHLVPTCLVAIITFKMSVYYLTIRRQHWNLSWKRKDIEFRTIIVEERVKWPCEDDAQSPSSRKAVKHLRSAAQKHLQSAPKDLCAISEKTMNEMF